MSEPVTLDSLPVPAKTGLGIGKVKVTAFHGLGMGMNVTRSFQEGAPTDCWDKMVMKTPSGTNNPLNDYVKAAAAAKGVSPQDFAAVLKEASVNGREVSVQAWSATGFFNLPVWGVVVSPLLADIPSGATPTFPANIQVGMFTTDNPAYYDSAMEYVGTATNEMAKLAAPTMGPNRVGVQSLNLPDFGGVFTFDPGAWGNTERLVKEITIAAEQNDVRPEGVSVVPSTVHAKSRFLMEAVSITMVCTKSVHEETFYFQPGAFPKPALTVEGVKAARKAALAKLLNAEETLAGVLARADNGGASSASERATVYGQASTSLTAAERTLFSAEELAILDERNGLLASARLAAMSREKNPDFMAHQKSLYDAFKAANPESPLTQAQWAGTVGPADLEGEDGSWWDTLKDGLGWVSGEAKSAVEGLGPLAPVLAGAGTGVALASDSDWFLPLAIGAAALVVLK